MNSSGGPLEELCKIVLITNEFGTLFNWFTSSFVFCSGKFQLKLMTLYEPTTTNWKQLTLLDHCFTYLLFSKYIHFEHIFYFIRMHYILISEKLRRIQSKCLYTPTIPAINIWLSCKIRFEWKTSNNFRCITKNLNTVFYTARCCSYEHWLKLQREVKHSNRTKR